MCKKNQENLVNSGQDSILISCSTYQLMIRICIFIIVPICRAPIKRPAQTVEFEKSTWRDTVSFPHGFCSGIWQILIEKFNVFNFIFPLLSFCSFCLCVYDFCDQFRIVRSSLEPTRMLSRPMWEEVGRKQLAVILT